VILGLDTATPATAVAVLPDHGEPVELRHEPAPGERPGHASQLLPLAQRALDALDATFADVTRIGVGVGPGTFTGLRIGVATARALSQSTGAELAAVSTLDALAEPAATAARCVLVVLDARRGEAFAAAYVGGERVAGPVAIAPEELPTFAERAATHADAPEAPVAIADPAHAPWLAVGDGAIRFRDRLVPAADVPGDDSTLHCVSALAVCRLAKVAPTVDRDALLPEYVRPPDAVPRR
jgi:tRNA threonylcarbamoyladenosine biosynthesis protein TsaB